MVRGFSRLVPDWFPTGSRRVPDRCEISKKRCGKWCQILARNLPNLKKIEGPECFDGFGGVCRDSGDTEMVCLVGLKKFCGFGRVRKGFWRIWKGLGGFCGFGKIWRFLQICNVFLRIWKGCGKASGGLEGFSLDLE